MGSCPTTCTSRPSHRPSSGIVTCLVTPWSVKSPLAVVVTVSPAVGSFGCSIGVVSTNFASGKRSDSRPRSLMALSRWSRSDVRVRRSASTRDIPHGRARDGERARDVARAAGRVWLDAPPTSCSVTRYPTKLLASPGCAGRSRRGRSAARGASYLRDLDRRRLRIALEEEVPPADRERRRRRRRPAAIQSDHASSSSRTATGHLRGRGLRLRSQRVYGFD